MDWEDFYERCGMIVEQAGENLRKIAVETALEFTWEVGNYGHNSDSTKETLTKSIGDMYITLMAVIRGYGVDVKDLEEVIDKQLGK